MSFTMTSPFAAISGDQIENLAESSPDGKIPDDDLVLEGFTGDSGSVYEIEDLDTLSALEKYCRSDMPTQRLVYAAGIGAAVSSLDPSAVSGTVVALLHELLGDVYADIRLTALQQTVAVARRLRSAGMTFQSNIERLWDVVQPLLLDADTEVQETAAAVLADLSHLVAWGNQVAASQKLVWAVQRCQRLPAEAMAEGAAAALRLITEVVAPREGSPLCFSSIQDFATTTFRDLATYEKSADVRQGAALLLPQFVRHMPPAVRATFLPGIIKALAQDSHWNVRAEVPQLLINILSITPNHQQQPNHHQSTPTFTPHGLASPPEPWPGASSSSGSGGSQALAVAVLLQQAGMLPQALSQQWQQQWTDTAGVTVTSAAAGVVGGGGAMISDALSVQERRTISSYVRDTMDRLCRDFSHQVKVAALASLGMLLPLLPAADAAAAKPPLLNLYISTAKPAASMSGVRVPQQLCAPRLSGRLTRRQQQQQRAKTQQQQQQQQGDGPDQPGGKADPGPTHNHDAMAVAAAAAGVPGAWDDLPLADTVAGAVDHQHSSGSTAAADGKQQHRRSFTVGFPAGTAGSELPMICAFYIGKVARHIGPSFWPLMQPAYLTLAAAAVDGDADIAAALLLSFPDLAAALGPEGTRSLLVPVVMGLLHSQLERLCPVLSVLLTDIMAALPQDLRICMLQLMPSLALQPDREVAGDWRARLSVAVQIPAVAALIAPAQVAYCLWPLLLTLAKDPVHAVRAAAAAQMGKVLLLLPEHEVPAQRFVGTTGNPSDQHPSDGSSSGGVMNAAAAAAAAAAGVDSGENGVAAASTAAAADAVSAVSSNSAYHQNDHQQRQQHQQQQTLIGNDVTHTDAAIATQPVQRQQQLVHHSDALSDHLDALAAAVGVDDDQGYNGHNSDCQSNAFEHHGDSRGAQRPMFDRMRRSLSIGLQQLQDGLQQGGDILMGHKATQAAINHMDRKIQWLQQQQAGSMLKNIGQRLSAAAAGASYTSAASSSSGSSTSSSSHEAALYSLGPLADRLDTTLDMLYNTVDPCQYLPTPAWYELVTDLDAFCNAGSSIERQVFAAAAGGVVVSRQQQLLSASSSNTLINPEVDTLSNTTPAVNGEVLEPSQKQQGLPPGQRQQQQQGTMHLQQLVHQLQQLAEDPVPGVRSRAAAIATCLLASTTPSLDHNQQQQQQEEEEPSGGNAATAATDCGSAASSSEASSSSSSSSSSDVSSGAASPASSSDSSTPSTDIEGGSGPLTSSSADTEAAAAAAGPGSSSTTPQDVIGFDGNCNSCSAAAVTVAPHSTSAASTTVAFNALGLQQPLEDLKIDFGGKRSEGAAVDPAAPNAAAAASNGPTDG